MKIAFLTSGGNAPCLSASIGRLLYNYKELNNGIEALGYKNGFSGLLQGASIEIPLSILDDSSFSFLYNSGGSLIGNSRVKLTNKEDCISKDLVKSGQDPLEVAAEQLIKDKVDILHTIGGDDTNTTAKDLSNYIKSKGSNITVVGIPKTIDNDIFPIKRSLGAYTAAKASATYFENIVNENNMSQNHLIIHEVMGRSSGWLTAYSAKLYCDQLTEKEKTLINHDSFSFYNLSRLHIHGIYVPEESIDFESEIKRLEKIMMDVGCLNIFVSEGAFIKDILDKFESDGKKIQRDAFGNIKLDSINTGEWLSEIISEKIKVDRILIQKSGYYARSSKPNNDDLNYIHKVCDFAFKEAILGNSGLAGEDERSGKLSCINFNEIKGNKALDTQSNWFRALTNKINQQG